MLSAVAKPAIRDSEWLESSAGHLLHNLAGEAPKTKGTLRLCSIEFLLLVIVRPNKTN
jgi:hypothetical protein